MRPRGGCGCDGGLEVVGGCLCWKWVIRANGQFCHWVGGTRLNEMVVLSFSGMRYETIRQGCHCLNQVI